MTKAEFIEKLENFTKNKTAQFAIAFLISTTIIYVTYEKSIKQNHIKHVKIQKTIKNTNLKKLKFDNKNLEKQKNTLQKDYVKKQKVFKKLEKNIHKTHYPIIIEVLDKINSNAFNIHEYRLDTDFKKMEITMVGSYQNLIRLIDLLGNIQAEIKIIKYDITIEESNLMKIRLNIEVEPIRI